MVGTDRLEGVSPEGLPTTLALASIGSRAMAGLIDLAIQIALIVAVTYGLGRSNV